MAQPVGLVVEPVVLNRLGIFPESATTVLADCPWRYRWPDSVRDEVLARLLALNADRYEQEVTLGLHSKGAKQAARAAKAGSTATAKRRGRPPKASQTADTEPMQAEQMGLGL